MKINRFLHNQKRNMVHGLATLALIILSYGLVSAQAQINVAFVLRPPYSSYLKDYAHLENKSIITLTNLTGNVKREDLEAKTTPGAALSFC